MMKKKLWFRLDLVHFNTINVVVLRSQKRKRSMNKMFNLKRHDIGWSNKSKNVCDESVKEEEKKHAQQPASHQHFIHTILLLHQMVSCFETPPISFTIIHSFVGNWLNKSIYTHKLYVSAMCCVSLNKCVIRYNIQERIQRPQIFIFFFSFGVNHTNTACAMCIVEIHRHLNRNKINKYAMTINFKITAYRIKLVNLTSPLN